SEDGKAGQGYYRLITYGGSLHGQQDYLQIASTEGLPQLGTEYSLSAGVEPADGGGYIDLYISSTVPDAIQHWLSGETDWGLPDIQPWLNKDSDLPVHWAGNTGIFKNLADDDA